MENRNEFYKLLQVTDVFVNNYEYTQVVIEQYKKIVNQEVWLYNQNNKFYQVIRISFYNAVQFDYDKERINTYLNYFKKTSNSLDIKFLDIHISSDKHDKEYEPYDYINLDINYSDGIDLNSIYPELYNVVHKVDDPNKEITSIISKMQKTIKDKIKSKPFLKRNPYIATYIVIGLCIINFLVSSLLQFKYNDKSSVLILMGADYKTFTLCLKEYYRLFTYAFVHNDFIHLICNLYSILIVGKYVEGKYGHLKFSLILVFSIICASLTQGILSDNSICIGLSGGIYGLMIVFIIDVIKNRIMDIRNLIPMVTINLFLNFLSNVAWTAHLGGAIAGFVMFYLLEDYKNVFRIVLILVFILCLAYKYVTINSIKSFYLGTDFNVLQILSDLGLDNCSNSLLQKLLIAYEKYGG